MCLEGPSTKGLGFGRLQKKAPKALNSLDAKLKSAPALPHSNARAITLLGPFRRHGPDSPGTLTQPDIDPPVAGFFRRGLPNRRGARKFSCLQSLENSRNVEIVALAPSLEAPRFPSVDQEPARPRPRLQQRPRQSFVASAIAAARVSIRALISSSARAAASASLRAASSAASAASARRVCSLAVFCASFNSSAIVSAAITTRRWSPISPNEARM